MGNTLFGESEVTPRMRNARSLSHAELTKIMGEPFMKMFNGIDVRMIPRDVRPRIQNKVGVVSPMTKYPMFTHDAIYFIMSMDSAGRENYDLLRRTLELYASTREGVSQLSAICHN